MCPLANKIIGICWGLFAVIWIVAAFSTKRSVYRESRRQRLRYSLLLVGAYLLLFRWQWLPRAFGVRLVPCTDTLALLSGIACVAGLAFCVWARITLGRNWSGTVTLKEGHELIERGPYRWVRHPIYTGLFVMYLATAILLGLAGGFIGTVLVFVSFWIKLGDEEKVMLGQFPDQYASYQERVKRIIPFVF